MRPTPQRPEAASGIWSNPALRFASLSDEEFEAIVDRQAERARAATETVRRWWLAELLTAPAPLRENLVLFLHGVFGSSTGAVDAPHALHGRNALLRRRCLGTVPDLLASLVVDPAMMIQIGMDGHGRLRVSDRPAKLILDHWTVGEGAYEPRDIEELSRTLTGWLVVAPEGRGPTRPLDPRVAMLREVVRSDAFWSESSRWRLIKSPIHLAAGACRQLGMASPPLAAIDRWLRASGQTLLDTPNNGEGGWPGQQAWVTPAARLAVRYHLAAALAGRLPPLGLERPSPSTDEAAAAFTVPIATTLREASAAELLERLDPAPGLDAGSIEREVAGVSSPAGPSVFIRRVMMSPHYQLA